MAILLTEKADIEKTINSALQDVSHANSFRLKAGLRILMTTNIDTFENICSPPVQEDLMIFKKLLSNPETLAPSSTQSGENKNDALNFIKHYTLRHLHLLDARTSILPNTSMIQKSIMEGERLKSVVHSSALRNVVMNAHYFDSLEKKMSAEGIAKDQLEAMVNLAKTYTYKLHKAVLEGNISMVLKCVSIHGVDVNFPNEQGMTPLHVAVRDGLTETVKILLTVPDINVNRVSNNGWTPLHMAARLGHADIADALLTMPAIDPNLVNSDGWSALHWAAWHGFTEVVTVLLAAPNIKINPIDSNNTTPLHLAARNGHADIISVLLSLPEILVNTVDNEQRTPLHLATIYNHEAAVNALLRSEQIDVNLVDRDDLSALQWAARNGQVEILDALLARPNIVLGNMDGHFMIPNSILKILKEHPKANKDVSIISRLKTLFYQ